MCIAYSERTNPLDKLSSPSGALNQLGAFRESARQSEENLCCNFVAYIERLHDQVAQIQSLATNLSKYALADDPAKVDSRRCNYSWRSRNEDFDIEVSFFTFRDYVSGATAPTVSIMSNTDQTRTVVEWPSHLSQNHRQLPNGQTYQAQLPINISVAGSNVVSNRDYITLDTPVEELARIENTLSHVSNVLSEFVVRIEGLATLPSLPNLDSDSMSNQ